MVNRVMTATDQFLAAKDRRWKTVRGRARYSLYGDALGKGYGEPTPEALEGAAQNLVLTGASGVGSP